MRKLLFATTILAPVTALAGGYIIPNENARDLGLSSAAVADQNGPEALFLNTAALAGPEGLAISASGEILVNRTTWSDPTLGSASLIPQYNSPPTGTVSFGKHLANDMAFGVGAGVDVPAGGSLIWPSGGQGQEFIQSVKQQVFRIGAGAAFQPLPYVKIGVSYLRYQATEELHQSLNFLDHFGDAGLGLSGGANSFGLAAEVRVPTIPLRFGANYTHSGDLALSGSAHFTAVPPAFSPLIHDQSVSEALTVPNVLVVGAAYDLCPNFTVMGAYTWERWSVYAQDKVIGSDGFTVTVPRNYNNAHVYRLAVEWKPESIPWVTVRGGGLRSISSQPTSTLSPSLTDGNSWAMSIGAGVDILPALRVDFGYQHAIFDSVTAATGTDAFPGTYRTNVDLFSLGINWRLGVGAAH